MPDLFWDDDNKLEFSVEFKDIESLYDVVFLLRHHTVYQYENLIFKLEIKTPKGSLLGEEHDMDIRNKEGEFIASGTGDYWDLDYVLIKNLRLEYPGTYTFIIYHTMPMEKVGGIIAAGLEVRKVKQKK